MSKLKKLVPLFDTLVNINEAQLPNSFNEPTYRNDFSIAIDFLKQYAGSDGTFRSYRREIERLLQWSWVVAQKSVLELKRQDIEAYIEFCKNPPKSWIGTKTVARFITQNGERTPNPSWRLFVASVSKADFKKGIRADLKEYSPSQKSIREIFTITSSFYSHLVNEGLVNINPVLLIRQKSKYFTKRQGSAKVLKLSEKQWAYCIDVAKSLASQKPEKYERTLFIMTTLYLLYLRISELTASTRWQPQMGHFYKGSNNSWWFVTLGKGNKERTISVSDEMLAALKRYREHLKFSPLPSPGEKTPLISKIRGKGALTSDREIRKIVQECFDIAVLQLKENSYSDEADALENATVHWLRHTGISDDINMRGRPESHVRDDAGHSSILITDRYNDVVLQERYLSGKQKSVKPPQRKKTKSD